MRIGDLAQRADVSVQTIRYYERLGLLGPAMRQASGYRVYRSEHLKQLNFVRQCRALDMPLAEIRRVRDLGKDQNASCRDVRTLVAEHLAHVRAKLHSLRRLETQLVQLRSKCDTGHRIADCGILAELVNTTHGEPIPR